MKSSNSTNSYKPLTPEEHQKRQVQFQEAIKPILNMKMHIYSVVIPARIVHPSGEIELKYNFTPEQQEALDSADEIIQEVHSQLFRPF